jgi:hypothetical protein
MEEIMNRLLKSILQTGLDVLDESDRWTRPMRGHIRDTADMVRRRVRGEDHTLRSVLFFAAGVGVGLGVGLLTAPVSGAESRSTISEKVKTVSGRVRNKVEENLGTGTLG